MKFLILLLGWMITLINSQNYTQCKTQVMKPNAIFSPIYAHIYILEGDEEDYKNINKLDQKIIQKSFTIPYQEIPIKILMIKPPTLRKIYERLMCSLTLKQKYTISCINIESLYFGQYNSQIEQINIQTNIDTQEICDQMYYQENQGFLLICFNNSTLKQYLISFNSVEALLFQYDIYDQTQDGCKRQELMLIDYQIIFMFYQCASWKVFSNINNQAKMLIQRNQLVFDEFQFVDQMESCFQQNQYFIYLIEKWNYLQLTLDLEGNIKQTVKKNSERKIMKFLLLSNCLDYLMITHNESVSFDYQNFSFNELSFKESLQRNNLHFKSNFLYVQNQTKLILMIDLQINQTYNILNSPVVFLESHNLFYQIDQVNKNIQFYKQYPLLTTIKPKLNYLFFFKRIDFLNSKLVDCIKIIYQQIQDNDSKINQIYLSIQCLVDFKSQVFLGNKYSLKKNSNQLFKDGINTLNISIWNTEIPDNTCIERLVNLKLKGKFNIRFIKIQNFVILDDHSHFYFIDCVKYKILFTLIMRDNEVFESNQKIYIYNKNKKAFTIIQLIEHNIAYFEQKIDVNVKQIQQIQNVFVLSFHNNSIPFLLDTGTNNINQLSSQLFQEDNILYYKEIGQIKFIQYNNILALEEQGRFNCFEFQEALIVEISRLAHSYLILAIHNKNNQILLYQFDLNHILLVSTYIFTDYVISQPLKYIYKFKKLTILITNNYSLFIAIFSLDEDLINFNEIIQINDSFFLYGLQSLFYHDINQQLVVKYFDKILIEVKQKSSIQSEFFQNYQFSLNMQEFEAFILLECNILQSYFQNTQIKLEQGQNIINLQISDYFFGPIDALLIQNNSYITLKGPIQLNQQLQDCSSTFLQDCFKIYIVSNQPQTQKPSEIKAIVIQNQLIIIQQQYFTQFYYINSFWLTETFYILFFQNDTQLYIQIVNLEEDNLVEISNLSTNFIASFPENSLVKTGNIILIGKQKILFFIQNFTVIQFNLPNQILDILYIENVKDLYISINDDYAPNFQIQVIIYRMNNLMDIEIVYSQIIHKELNMLFTQILNLQDMQLSQFQQMKLLKCQQNDKFLLFNLFVAFVNYSFITQFQIDIEDQKIIKSTVLQYIRNYGKYYSLQNQILVMKQENDTWVYYDLRQPTKFQNYIHRTTDYIYMQSLNTTHFVFTNKQQLFIGIFGYFIEIKDSNKMMYNLVLEAQNQVSSIELPIQLTIEPQRQKVVKIIFIIHIINLIFIIVYSSKCQKNLNYLRK